jgi:hypothetical protein
MLKRSAMPPRTKRINPVSRKRRAQAPARRACIAAVRERSGGRCEFVGMNGQRCKQAGDHVHEILSRARGGSITDEANCLDLCWWHHNRVHLNPAWATERGLLRSRTPEAP